MYHGCIHLIELIFACMCLRFCSRKNAKSILYGALYGVLNCGRHSFWSLPNHTHTCTKLYTALEVITELAFVAACSSNLFEARLARMYFNVLMSLHVCLISLLMIQFALQWMKLDILWSRFEYSIECSILCVFVNMWDIHGKLMTKSNSPTSANSTHRYPCSMSLLALFPLLPSESKCTSFLSFTYPPLNPFVGSPNILEVLLAIENVKEPKNGHTIYMEATNSSSCTCAPHAWTHTIENIIILAQCKHGNSYFSPVACFYGAYGAKAQPKTFTAFWPIYDDSWVEKKGSGAKVYELENKNGKIVIIFMTCWLLLFINNDNSCE